MSQISDEAVVLHALRNALDNGYDEVLTDPVEKVAADIGTYCQDVEGGSIESLIAPITEAQRVLKMERQEGNKYKPVCEHIRALEAFMRHLQVDVSAEHAEEPFGWTNVWCGQCGRCHQIRLATERP